MGNRARTKRLRSRARGDVKGSNKKVTYTNVVVVVALSVVMTFSVVVTFSVASSSGVVGRTSRTFFLLPALPLSKQGDSSNVTLDFIFGKFVGVDPLRRLAPLIGRLPDILALTLGRRPDILAFTLG